MSLDHNVTSSEDSPLIVTRNLRKTSKDVSSLSPGATVAGNNKRKQTVSPAQAGTSKSRRLIVFKDKDPSDKVKSVQPMVDQSIIDQIVMGDANAASVQQVQQGQGPSVNVNELQNLSNIDSIQQDLVQVTVNASDDEFQSDGQEFSDDEECNAQAIKEKQRQQQSKDQQAPVEPGYLDDVRSVGSQQSEVAFHMTPQLHTIQNVKELPVIKEWVCQIVSEKLKEAASTTPPVQGKKNAAEPVKSPSDTTVYAPALNRALQ